MPYIPFIPPAAGAPIPMNSPITGYTNGVIFGRDYTLHLNNIALELNRIGFFLSPAGTLDAGSLAASISSSAQTLATLQKNMGSINQNLIKLDLSVQKISNKIEVSTKGVATISSHMGKQTVIQTMALNNDMKKAEFEKLVTNQAQEAAGQPKTVVTPAAFTEKAKEVITDVTTSNALIEGAALVQNAIATATSAAFTTASTWIAESAFGQWVKDTYAEQEIAFVGLFSKEKAEKLKDELEARRLIIQAGGVPK